MIVYVKECFAINLNTIMPWFKKTINIMPLSSFDAVKTNDIIVMSNADDDFCDNDLSGYNIVIYEDFCEKITLNIIQAFQYNYDYYYLKNALSIATNSNTISIISGSSYGLFGIDTSLLSNAINLSLMSQDLYYSLKGIYYVCSKNRNIKNIVLCVGYYCFFSDLSKTQNPDEIQRVSKVYNPLYADIHNCSLLPPPINILYESDIFDIQNILDIYTQGEYLKGYFHNERPRKKYATKIWDDKSKEWYQLSIGEKEEAGKQRASLHNKNIKRENSLLENVKLFQDFLRFCGSKNINLLLVVTPSTPYYLNCLLPDFKLIFYNILNEVDSVIHLLDLAEDTTFLDEDFNDTDHLNKKGAQKLTQIILNTLQEINNS